MEILIEGSLDYCEVKEWKKRYFVMKYEISSGLRYIEIYKDKNWRKQLPRHVVNLHPGYEVRRKEDLKKKNCFSIKTTDHCLMLASDDENISSQWMATLEEYNLVKSFCVQPQETPTMIRIEAIDPCHLQLVHSEVRLVSAMDGNLLGLWPFKCIRRYKFLGNVFCIEAGRKAPTGEGMFEFISNECSEIYRVMDTIIRTKAGDSTMRRLASEKIQQRVTQPHVELRKTKSVPHSTINQIQTGELHYDYASRPGKMDSKSPPVNLPSVPKRSTLAKSSLESESTYDVLSPDDSSPGDSSESKFCKQPETVDEEDFYNTLQFEKSSSAEKNKTMQFHHDSSKTSGSAGSYDTLQFHPHSPPENTFNRQTLHTKKGTHGSYDKLQFNHRPRLGRSQSSSSTDDIDGMDDVNDPDGLGARSGSMYNTLNHNLTTSQPSSFAKQDNTYDSLTNTLNPSQPDTLYNCLGQTKPDGGRPKTLDVSNTYDQLHDTQKPKSPERSSPVRSSPDPGLSGEKPMAPQRPPPRKRVSKPSAPTKPSKPLKPSRKVPSPSKDTQEAPKQSPQQESLSDVIQTRLAKASDDDSYATVDHEYASIDYSKVSRPENNPSTDDVYTDIDDKATPSNRPKPAARTKIHPPKGMKNLFKKHHPSPKTKTVGADGEGSFSDELKKKLDRKLKKSEDSTGKGSGAKPKTNLPKSAQGENDDSIYDEVDTSNSSSTLYCEPGFTTGEMNV